MAKTDITPEKIPDFIKKIQTEHGLSGNKLAKMCGIPQSTFCRISQGEPCSLKNYLKITSLAELFIKDEK